jgi:hypothetical protein
MIQVLTIDQEYESALRLGYKTHPYMFGHADDFDDSIMIRWGYGGSIYNKDGKVSEFKFVVNTQTAISLNCQKDKALKELAKVVKTPAFYDTEVPAGKLVVVRPTYHTGGIGFVVKPGPFELLKDEEYATEFLKTNTEFRVWFANDQTLCARRVTKKEVEKYPCRSKWGYKFQKISKSLHKQTLLAAKQIGLETGAADVLWYKGSYYFLELNSAPSVDMMKIERFYKRNIPILLKKKYPKLMKV